MTTLSIPHFLTSLILFAVIVLSSGCATFETTDHKQMSQSSDERTRQLLRLQDWTVNGKIAFIQEKKRESAFLQWHVQQTKEKQQLDLNTYLGINVLHLESNKNIHTIKVDGKTYHGENIESLIFSITGLTLPAQALTYWLKGLPYTPDDEIIFDDNTQLPKTLTSQYNNVTWQLSFDDYQQIDVYILAKKITIKQNNLLIKIAINQWTF